jgi:hypothetical protein
MTRKKSAYIIIFAENTLLKDKMMDVFSKTRRVTDVFLTLLIELP